MLCYLQRYTLSADRQRINHEIAEPHGRIILYSHYSITQYVKDRIKTTTSGCLKRESVQMQWRDKPAKTSLTHPSVIECGRQFAFLYSWIQRTE